jgi:toxin ParE1/3/4
MTKYKLLYAKDALDDLDSIFAYISEDNRQAALGMLDRIESAIYKLETNPRLGVVVQPLEPCILESGYRTIYVKPYMIFYRIGKEAVYIAHVLHSRQNWLSLLFDKDYSIF